HARRGCVVGPPCMARSGAMSDEAQLFILRPESIQHLVFSGYFLPTENYLKENQDQLVTPVIASLVWT
ncbi:hypothetical protein, partial [Streptomyces sp. NPDC054863]